MKLNEAIQRDLETARVFLEYANRDTIKLWNSLRAHDEPIAFGGWYWLHGYREGGPFRCESAAMRDAWYRICLKREPPAVFTMRRARKDRQTHLRVVG
jgi:hypothetical protein